MQKVDSSNYVELATRTEAPVTNEMKGRFTETGNIRLLHAGIGMATEAGEFLDALKKHLFYGKPVDRTNLAEEIGDLMWYCALALSELDAEFDATLRTNILKLAARYGSKFTEFAAENRDLKTERQILECFNNDHFDREEN